MTKPTALISVYDKTGVVEFARGLVALDWDIISTGGTADRLRKEGVPVKLVEDYVGEVLFGDLVKTLDRRIHAGLLAPDTDDALRKLEELGIPRIDLVCCNLYPLVKAIADPDKTRASVIKNTDIGGPTMLRSGAKGDRIVVCDPADYDDVLTGLKGGGRTLLRQQIDDLAGKAEGMVAAYCLASARERSGGKYTGMVGERVKVCTYGENKWQSASLFKTDDEDPLAIHRFRLVGGADESFNNLKDLHWLLQAATHVAAAFEINIPVLATALGRAPSFTHPEIAVAVKHNNSCGAAIGSDRCEVITKMADGNRLSLFGGLVMLTFPLTVDVAEAISGTKLDGIIAPGFEPQAMQLLERRHGKCRFLENPSLASLRASSLDTRPILVPVRGGFLEQTNYTYVLDLGDPRITGLDSSRALDASLIPAETVSDMLLAWAIGSTAHSNTIALAKGGMLLGLGTGQQDRVGCCKLAIERARDARHDLRDGVAYSDSFFPHWDGVATLALGGIKTILTSSGSIQDRKVREVCTALDVNAIFIPDEIGRGFRH